MAGTIDLSAVKALSKGCDPGRVGLRHLGRGILICALEIGQERDIGMVLKPDEHVFHRLA